LAAPQGSDAPYLVVPGHRTFEAGHIPGADFLDLQKEFSDSSTRLRFMIAQLEDAFGRHGLDASKDIVLYSIGTMMCATRFWWMLRSLGVATKVLHGGFDKWKAEGRPVESGQAKGYPAATFKALPRPGLFVDKSHVLARMNDPATTIINALGPQFHRGLEPLVSPTDKTLTTLADAEAKFASPVPRSPGNICTHEPSSSSMWLSECALIFMASRSKAA
jgi:thiosulfate/3-mercaptopyruvate sulfurtransferase